MMRRFLALALLLCAAADASATQFRKAEDYVLPEDQSAAEELWLLADTVDVRGTTDDDFFAAGNELTFSGEARSDVWAAGESVTFLGHGTHHVRLAGRTLTVNGRIDRGLAAAGNALTVSSETVVGGDALLAGESVVSGGRIGGNLRVVARSATVGGGIGGNLRVVGEDIVIMPGTEIGGSLTYTSSKELVLDRSVKLGGELIRKELQAGEARAAPSLEQVLLTQGFLYLCALFVGIPFAALFPRFTGRAVRLLRQGPWKCLLTGVVACCLMPMVAFFALLTVVGLLFSVLLVQAYIFLLYLAKIIVALALASAILRRRGPQPFSRVFTALSLGLVLLYVLVALPAVGVFVWLLIVLFGLGALVLAVFSSDPPEAAAPPAPPAAPVRPELPREAFPESRSTGDEQPTKE